MRRSRGAERRRETAPKSVKILTEVVEKTLLLLRLLTLLCLVQLSARFDDVDRSRKRGSLVVVVLYTLYLKKRPLTNIFWIYYSGNIVWKKERGRLDYTD